MIAYSDIAALAFTGRDTAAGKSWEAWVKKYVEKKAAGEKAHRAGARSAGIVTARVGRTLLSAAFDFDFAALRKSRPLAIKPKTNFKGDRTMSAHTNENQRLRGAKLSFSISSFTSSALPPMNVNETAYPFCNITRDVCRTVSVPRALLKSPRTSLVAPTKNS